MALKNVWEEERRIEEAVQTDTEKEEKAHVFMPHYICMCSAYARTPH